MNYMKLITTRKVWHGYWHDSGVELVVNTDRPFEIFTSYDTGDIATAIWCWKVVGGYVTDQPMQVWNFEVVTGDFEIINEKETVMQHG